MKNLSKTIYVILFFAANSLVFLGCNQERQLQYEDFNEEDFVMVPGIIIKTTKTPIIRSLWYEYNLYYAYNLESDTILVGKEMDVDLALKKGDGFYVLVNKKDKGISFIAGPRLLPKDQKILESYLLKSKENGVKYYGVK